MESHGEREFKVGEWWARPAANELRRADVVVPIESRSMEVLVCLARKASAVLGKQEILDEVWGETFVGDEVVSHAIWELRRTFRDDARNPKYIQTLSKKGYRLVAEVSWSSGDGRPEIGARIGSHKIVDILGRGAMGVVYKAKHEKLGRTVALKFLSPEMTSDAEARERFLREARLAASLDHPHLGSLHEIGESRDGQLYLISAFYDGGSLKERLANGPLPVSQGVRIAGQIARGLAEMHRHGIIHRDVKPANIMLTVGGGVKLVDFGIAKLVGGTRLTQTGALLGTPSYKSPEQSRGDPVDHRSDIWSLGVVLFELLSGKKPFGGDYDQAIVHSILEQEPPILSSVDVSVPEALERVLGKALAKDPSDRFQDIDDFAQALDDVLEPEVAHPLLVASRPRRFRSTVYALAAAALVILSVLVLKMTPDGLRPPDPAAVSIAAGSAYEARNDSIGNLEDATDAYRAALVAVPGHPEATGRLAATLLRIYVQTSDEKLIEEARQRVREAEEVDPELWTTWLAKAKLLFVDGRYDLAVEAARQAVCRVPEKELDRDLAWALLGESQIKTGAVEEGRKSLETAMMTERGSVRSRLVWANLLDERGDLSEAMVEYEKVEEIDPNNIKALWNLGLLYADMGRNREALRKLQRVRVRRPSDHRVYNNLGLVYYNLATRGEPSYWQKAIEAFEHAVELDPEYETGHIGLGDTYLMLGRVAESRDAFARALPILEEKAASRTAPTLFLARYALCLAKLDDI